MSVGCLVIFRSTVAPRFVWIGHGLFFYVGDLCSTFGCHVYIDAIGAWRAAELGEVGRLGVLSLDWLASLHADAQHASLPESKSNRLLDMRAARAGGVI